MKGQFLLGATFIFLIMPLVSSLNCTLFYGNNYQLCGIIEPLSLSEGEKQVLMQEDIYHITSSDNSVNLQLEQKNEEPITLESIYEEKIVLLGKIFFLVFSNYALFSVLTKSSFGKKWLIADY